MEGRSTSIFDGVAPAELEPELRSLARRRYAAGDVLIRQGEESPGEVLVVESGVVDVLIVDDLGVQHRVNRGGPGAICGEMSIITGQSTAATVQAATDLTVVVIDESNFRRLADRFPRIYLNLGILLAERLSHAKDWALGERPARTVLIEDHGGPPLLGPALAASAAWHLRAPTLALSLGGTPPEATAPLVARGPGLNELQAVAAGAQPAGVPARAAYGHVRLEGEFAPASLPATVENLGRVYGCIVLQAPPGAGVTLPATRRLSLASPAAHAAACDLRVEAWSAAGGARPGRDGVLRVAAPAVAEEREIGEGLLSPRGAAGRALGWPARDAVGLKVGLALGAGAVKGYAHVGVLRGLQALGVPIDYVAGTSIGAAVAALHADGQSPETIAGHLDTVGSAAFRPAVPRRALLSNSGLLDGLRRLARGRRIEDLALPLAVVAADLISQREMVFQRGPLWPAVLASMSIPGIYPPQRRRDALLVDGGVLNPVPSRVAAEMGADVVLAVKLSSPPSARDRGGPAAREPGVLQAITRSIELMQSQITDFTAATASVLLEPRFPAGEGWGLRNFSQGRRFIPLGEQAVFEAREQIGAVLPWVRG